MPPENWTVIVVEDTYDDIQLASVILKHHGITVQIAHNGQECLHLLEAVDPTLIITDLAMPEMDGWAMLSALRANEKTQHIPVVAMTAYHSVDVAHDAKLAGFDAYFAKPLNPRAFVNDLMHIVG